MTEISNTYAETTKHRGSKTRKKKRSPMMEQYWSIKEAHPDKIVFFRMGDFYELFYKDAQTAAPLLGLTLTSRNKKSGDETPMCGMPHHSVSVHINKLLASGYKVALCDQVEDPKQAKGIVRREVTRILTPGMVFNPDELDSQKPHYLASWDVKGGTLSFLEPTTGECFFYSDWDGKDFLRILQSLSPVEIVLGPERLDSEKARLGLQPPFGRVVWSAHAPKASDASKGSDRLEAALFKEEGELPSCAKRLVSYGLSTYGALRTEGGTNPWLSTLSPFTERKFKNRLKITHRVQNHLEVFKTYGGVTEGTLYSAINRTKTAGGARTLRQWLQFPLGDPRDINQRLDAVEKWMSQLGQLKSVRKKLAGIGDLERRFGKVGQPQVHPRDFVQLGRALEQALEILPLAENSENTKDPGGVNRFSNGGNVGANDGGDNGARQSRWSLLHGLARTLNESFLDELPKNFREGGFLRSGIFSELDELIASAAAAQKAVGHMEAKEREATGIPSLKVRYNNVFGYFIEVTNTHKSKVPLGRYRRKQTLTNAERYVTEELDLLEQKVLAAKTKRAELELTYFNNLKQDVLAVSRDILQLAHIIARVDVLTALAWLALENNYVRPQWNDQGLFEIEGGRHPVVEKSLGSQFVENDIRLQRGRAALLTGPNMAGKSTIMRQLAITVLLAQMGSLVPARRASLSLVDQIFTRIGASDSLTEGLSTFMVEMKEAAEMLNESTSKSLVILDEVGRGTSTSDGVALAQSILEYFINERGPSLLFATHYHELTQLAQVYPEQVVNFHMGIESQGDKTQFTYQLEEGPSGRSYGVQVAAMAGLPQWVIDRARSLLGSKPFGESLSLSDTAPVESLGAGFKEDLALTEPAFSAFSEGQMDLFSSSGPVVVSKGLSKDFLGAESGPNGAADKESPIRASLNKGPQVRALQPKEKAALEDLKKISIHEMTPLEALNKISQWQKELF